LSKASLEHEKSAGLRPDPQNTHPPENEKHLWPKRNFRDLFFASEKVLLVPERAGEIPRIGEKVSFH